MTWRRWLPIALAATLATAPAYAQDPVPQPPTSPPTLPPPDRPERPRPPAPEDPPADDAAGEETDATTAPVTRGRGLQIRPRLFGIVGGQTFTASDSFSAVLDTSSGPVYGGGGGLLFGRNLFVDVSVTRFTADGTRVFVTGDGEVIDLGIDTSVAVTPIDVSIGWRFAGTPRLNARGRPRFRPVPFAGGGFGVQQYEETADFADAGDDVTETHGSYHVLGGVELPFTRRIGASADVLYRWVPDAIGEGGVSAYYEEDDLGGLQFRVRFVFTF